MFLKRNQIAVAHLAARAKGDLSGGAALDPRCQVCNVEEKVAVAEAYFLRLLRRRYNGVIFPDFAGIDATIFGSGSPKEWGTVLAGREHFASFDAAAVSGGHLVSVHCPAARMDTNRFSVYLCTWSYNNVPKKARKTGPFQILLFVFADFYKAIFHIWAPLLL